MAGKISELTAATHILAASEMELLQGGANLRAAMSLITPFGYIGGLLCTNNGTDATNDIDVSVGAARDGSDTLTIRLASAITKRLDASWAVGSAAGGLDTGSVATSTVYYVWLILRSDTGVVDVLFSTSATAPTMPTNYDYKRLIGSFYRTSGGVNNVPRSRSLPFTEWATYTPTFTGLGTVSGVNFKSRRNGPNVEIMGGAVSGTSTAVEARMEMGMGTSGNITSAAWLPAFTACGPLALSVANAAGYEPGVEPSKTYLVFSYESGGGTTKATGENFFSTGRTFSLFATVPIEGW